MSLFQSIINFLTKKEEKQQAPEGFCPNCWGRQEYEGQFFEAMKNEGINVNNVSEKVGWVQDYADKHLAGIHLQPEGEGLVCSKCKVTYRAN